MTRTDQDRIANTLMHHFKATSKTDLLNILQDRHLIADTTETWEQFLASDSDLINAYNATIAREEAA